MIKKFFICFLTMCVLIVPINVYANEMLEIKNDSYLNETINSAVEDEREFRPEIKIEYNQSNQKVLENSPKIGCKAAYVADSNTGKIFYEKNAHEKMYPASTSKILTALLVLENCKLDKKAVVTKNAIDLVPSGYSNALLKEGEEIDIKTLLKALLIPSANEAANVLAEYVSGSVEAFAELCNNRAKELGCENLHFVNPNGIHNENHYCTAYDLYLIAKECQKYDVFNEIVKTKSFTIPATKIYPKNDRTFENTNSLILPSSKNYYYPYCTGIKTGHTSPAGECLVASSLNNNINLISVVLGGNINNQGLNERFYDTKTLFEFVYNNYKYKKIIDKKQVVETIKVKKATKDTNLLDVIVDADILEIVPNDLDLQSIQKNITIAENITAPVEMNQGLGYLTFEIDGMEYNIELTAKNSVPKIPFLQQSLVIVVILVLLVLIVFIVIKIKKQKSIKKEEIL